MRHFRHITCYGLDLQCGFAAYYSRFKNIPQQEEVIIFGSDNRALHTYVCIALPGDRLFTEPRCHL